MKYLFTLSLFIFGFSLSAQIDTINKNSNVSKIELTDSIGEFNFGMEGLTDFIVLRLDTAINYKDMYSLVINWIKETYKMPDKVIQTTIENDMIRIEGVNLRALTYQTALLNISYDLKYTIEFRLKDGKIKIDPISLNCYVPSSQYVVGGWYPVPIDSNAINYYKYSKKTKMYELRKENQSYPIEISKVFNDLSLSLFNYLKKHKGTKNITENSKSDW